MFFNNLYREIEGDEEHAMINICREIEDMFVLKTCISRSKQSEVCIEKYF